MQLRTRLSMLAGLTVMGLATIIIAVLAFPVMAAPGAVTNPDPTPTLPALEDVSYTLEKVGGVDQTLTFDLADQDAFTIGETTVTSQYPRGMTFTLDAQSENGAISDVTLYYKYVHDSGSRVDAEYDADNDQWVAHLWPTGEGTPVFMHLRLHWRIRDETDVFVDTEDFVTDYWDPNREWYRMESDDIVVYWFGFMEDDPDYIARGVAERMAAASDRQIAGFGRRLSYKPLAMVYPDLETLGEIFPGGAANDNMIGFTSSDLGVSVQILYDLDQIADSADSECVWASPPESWTLEKRVERIFDATPHEVTHLYQYDVIGFPPGYLWVSEGQAEFFANNFRGAWERLPYLATLQDLTSLRNQLPSNIPAADGCGALAYTAGAAFWNFLNINYGGMDTIAEIVALQRQQKSIYEAVETVTGKPFLEVENEWRVSYGFRELTLEDVDPAAALQPYDDPMLAEGDTVTLPAMPPLSSMKEKPGPKSLPGPQCFGNTAVEILTIGALDDIPYYEIDCMGMIGWVTRDQLVGPGN